MEYEKTILKFLAFCAIISSSFSCSSHEIKVTINSGLGYFFDGEYEEEITKIFITKTFVVNSGTSFSSLSFPKPLLISRDDEVAKAEPVFYSVNGKRIEPNYIINDDITITAEYYNNLISAKNYYYRIYMNAFIGALRKIGDYASLLKFLATIDEDFDSLQSIYAYSAFSAVAATFLSTFSQQAIKPDDYLLSLYKVMTNQIKSVTNQCGSELITCFTGILRSIKRIFNLGKEYKEAWWEQFIVDTSNAMKNAGINKAHYLSRCIDRLSMQIADTAYEGNPIQTDVNNFVFKIFYDARDENQAYLLTSLTKTFIADFEQAIDAGTSTDALVAEYKAKAQEILNS